MYSYARRNNTGGNRYPKPRVAANQWVWSLLIVLVFSLLCLITVGADTTPDGEISQARLSNFIALATSYIARVSHTAEQDPENTGKFTYIAFLKEDLPLDFTTFKQKSYNLLRHNGAIYSLALSYKRQKDPEVLEAMQRSIAYLKREAIGPVPDVSGTSTEDDQTVMDQTGIPNLLAAWETKAITGGSGSITAKLGGAGLALISLVSMEQISPGVSDLSYLRKLGSFVKYLQHEDGSFTCRYIPADGGRDDSWSSLYYPGEAALGMIYLASIETDEEYRQTWIDVATKAITYLETLRRTQQLGRIEPDHWALLATKDLLPLLDEKSKEYWLVYDHGVRVVKSMMDGHSKQELTEVHKGCFTQDFRTCPTATRMEGMIAALSFVREHEMFTSDNEEGAERLLDRMHHDIRAGINFLLNSQETDESNNMHGAVPVKFPSEDHKAKEVRVDYVQHSMSAMIAYEKLLQSPKSFGLKSHKLRIGPVKDMIEVGDQSMFLLPVLVLVVAVVVAAMSRKSKAKNEKHIL